MTRPNFVVLGVPKAGTTSLYSYLNQHPEVAMSKWQEPRFLHYAGSLLKPGSRCLTQVGIRSIEEYERQFIGKEDRKARGDITPQYFFQPDLTILGIHQYIPEAKLIAIFRQPADRAYSSYLMNVRLGRETKYRFAEALKAEDAGVPLADGFPRTYSNTGFYFRRVREFQTAFSKGQLLFLLYDDLVGDPEGFMRSILRFLEVDSSFLPDMSRRRKVGAWPRSLILHRGLSIFLRPTKRFSSRFLRRQITALSMINLGKAPKMDSAIRARLTQAYRDDILALQELLGRDLSGWLAGA
jgi:hypothetical protein